jgi:acyl dehydratase
MALNTGFIGRTYPPSAPYEVGREKIREFATAIGDQNPAYHDVAAARALGHADVVAPPTFPFVITHRAMDVALFDPDLGLEYSQVVHGDQRFAYTRPVVAGDVLVVHGTIENIRSMAGNDLLTFRGDVTTTAGEPVVSAWSVIVSRGTAQEG